MTSFVFSQWEVDRKCNEVSERWEREFSRALEKENLNAKEIHLHRSAGVKERLHRWTTTQICATVETVKQQKLKLKTYFLKYRMNNHTFEFYTIIDPKY